jgi:hypothetical protein
MSNATEPGRITEVGTWRGWLCIAVLLAILGAVWYANARAEEADRQELPNPYGITAAVPDQRGTEQKPLVVSKPHYESERQELAEREHSRNESRTTLATIALAIFTVALWLANVWLIWDARRVSDRQEKDTQAALREQTRAADAMRDVADATRNNAVLMSGMLHKQMRAYISVDIGSGIYQDAKLRFEAIPALTNNGLTPARNVCYKVLAGIFDGSGAGPLNFEPIGDLVINDVGIAPRQSFTIRGAVPMRVPDSDVPLIMEGNTKRLFAWGKVVYDDVYGGSWETNFCISYYFRKIGKDIKVFGNFYHVHNNAT